MTRRRKMNPKRKAFIKNLPKHYRSKGAQDVQKTPKDLPGETLQGMPEAEMENHLEYSRYDYRNKEADDSRNGYSPKTVISSMDTLDLDIPRDRKGELSHSLSKKSNVYFKYRGSGAFHVCKRNDLSRDFNTYARCLRRGSFCENDFSYD